MHLPRWCLRPYRHRPMLPLYHAVCSDFLPHLAHLIHYRDTETFEKDLNFYLQNFTPVNPGDLLDHVRHGKPLPPYSFLLSFDDSLSQCHDIIAPLLKARGLSAIFFVSPAFIGNRQMFYRNLASLIVDSAMAGDQTVRKTLQHRLSLGSSSLAAIRSDVMTLGPTEIPRLEALARSIGIDPDHYLEDIRPYLDEPQLSSLIEDGFWIGSHGWDHRYLQEMPIEEQIEQTVRSLDWLQERFAIPYRFFSFPHDDRGVTEEYFSSLNGRVELYFATGGPERRQRNHFHRIWMERERTTVKRRIFCRALSFRLNRIVGLIAGRSRSRAISPGRSG